MVAGDRQRDGGRRTVVGVDSVVYRQRDFFCPRLTDDGLGQGRVTKRVGFVGGAWTE
jgi:hypothetical protein